MKPPSSSAASVPRSTKRQRVRWYVEGVVQGVGFRPFVTTIARREGLVGYCGNDERGVFIEAEGLDDAIAAFRTALFGQLPALSRIVDYSEQEIPPLGAETEFRIVSSRHAAEGRALIPPDTALCEDCRREFYDPTNPRYLYPFISCTNCGPRLSIITELPYDRPRTTMAAFPMCAPCEREYTDPADRRFHAQPISCFQCGPRLSLICGEEQKFAGTREEVLALFESVHSMLDDGAILAVKGIGGFHLVCDARNDDACQRLRERKRRPAKPLAVMAPNLAVARQLVSLSDAEEALLSSAEAPIVIAVKRQHSRLSESIAPGLDRCGVMLAYSGIHLLLCDRPLVVTSGNLSGEPICTDNDEALSKLGHIADAFVVHDRDIHVPVEDSVFIGTTPSRRSRGFAPLPIPATSTANRDTSSHITQSSAPSAPTVFATGGELKNTFALAHQSMVHISAHIGDMGSWTSQRAYARAADQLLSMRHETPDLIVCDMHPGYATTSFAEKFADEHDTELLYAQHHWAHALSLLAEHRLLMPDAGASSRKSSAESQRANIWDSAVIAALDGTGYGTDGTIWGGEILEVSRTSAHWKRVWHCPTFALVGGDRAVSHPWRLAAGLAHSWGLEKADVGLSAIVNSDAFSAKENIHTNIPSKQEIALVRSQLESGLGTVQTSSLGRIFDAAAALLLPHWKSGAAISYEAQAAMELEAAANRYVRSHPEALQSAMALDCSFEPESFEALLAEVIEIAQVEQAAFEFHRGVASIVGKQIAAAAAAANDGFGTELVGVSGGCANNALLISLLDSAVTAHGLNLLQHRSVPPGDGGLSLGQAMAGLLTCQLADTR